MIGKGKARWHRGEEVITSGETAEETGAAQGPKEPEIVAFIHSWIRMAFTSAEQSESPTA
jgi:hypothetical protein